MPRSALSSSSSWHRTPKLPLLSRRVERARPPLIIVGCGQTKIGRWPWAPGHLTARVARRFAHVEPRRRARAYVLGLPAELPRKNCRTIAEHAGCRAPRNVNGVRDHIRDFVVEHLGNQNAVPVMDETVT